jgi:hypothetical protein
MSYGAIAAGFAEVDYYAGIESDSPPPEPVTTIPVILVATGDGEGTGSYGYLSYLQITGYGANGRWNASGGVGAGGDSQFDLNADLNLYPGQVYSVQARARCGAEAGQTTNVLSSACQAMVDPVFIFDQATFDAEMGANTFPLDEYFSLQYSPNMDISSIPEPSTLLLTGFGIAVLAPCLRRRRVLPRPPEAHLSISPSTVKILALALALFSMPALVLADSFTSVVVYGDSLSDNGNLFAATGQPPAPYFEGRRSDGPVAVEQLATALGAPLYDFAWIGATTGIGNIGDGGTPTSFGAFGLPGMQTELALTQGSLWPLHSSGLFVVWGGPDDFLSPSPLDISNPLKIGDRGVGDLLEIVMTLQDLGAKHILVPGMPNLGLTPFIQGEGAGAATQFTQVTNYFNAELRAGLPAGVTYYDTATLLREMVADPGKFGFTNVTDPCFNGTTVCSDPNQYLFWDTFHPTTTTDAFVAQAFEEAVAVPEPAAIGLLPAALALCLILRKRDLPH